jgi:hypothetical protein
MPPAVSSEDTLFDYITGRAITNAGAENNRQTTERYLVESKGYDREDIEVDTVIRLDVGKENFQATVDLVIRVNGYRFMAIKCAAGSLSSREKEIIAAARLLDDYQIPFSAATDGSSALVWDSVSGDLLGSGLDTIPPKSEAESSFNPGTLIPLDEKRRHKQKLIYRTYATQSCATGVPLHPEIK